MRTLDYQARVLETLDAYLDALKSAKRDADEVAEMLAAKPHLKVALPNFPAEAWNAMQTAGKLPPSRASFPFSPRADGCKRPVPNITFKVPTGGGKTFLAVNAVSRVLGRYLGRNTGFVLWVVPNEAIYSQTLKRLKDRQHPYRQTLDRAAAGRVKVMEREDALNARDIEANLCVMLLMLPAAAKHTKESLRMFRDRGNVHGFFPAEGEQQAHAAALKVTPNLDAYGGTMFSLVKDSLGNALRVIRPVVVMDEGQRAVSNLAYDTLYGFNPVFVLELSATPKDVKEQTKPEPRPARYANLLVEVTGRELDREGMIKMPLNLDPKQGTDWKATLTAAVATLDGLNDKAKAFTAETNRYIRPIMLVQVERTGKEQREVGKIHALDVKEWLLTAGFDDAEIAIKTAEQNDLNQPENQDLLSPLNRVRVIITKQALQEGWDCPFAYVLCALAASTNPSAMTQLVGRILRQPQAAKTGVAALDECHVITHHAATGEVVSEIKNGLEKDGLADLVMTVSGGEAAAEAKVSRKVKRRTGMTSLKIYLPKVLRVEGDEARDLDYETDLLAAIDWRGFDPVVIADGIPENAQAAAAQMQRIGISEDGAEIVITAGAVAGDAAAFDPSYAVRVTSDLVPNPFVGREIVGALLKRLRKRGFSDDKIGRLGSLIIEELRRGLESERNARAEALFKSEVAGGRIQFRLRLDGRDWKMPSQVETTEPENARQLMRADGSPLEKSLFAPVYEAELNGDERDVAVYLDRDDALNWWHRNVARQQYALQGWRRDRIYPDFIFAATRKGKTKRLTILETKGPHLDNLDTAYKREVLKVLTEKFAWAEGTAAGTLEVVTGQRETVECALILLDEWRAKLPGYLA